MCVRASSSHVTPSRASRPRRRPGRSAALAHEAVLREREAVPGGERVRVDVVGEGAHADARVPSPSRIAAWPGDSRESRRSCSASRTSARSPGRSRSRLARRGRAARVHVPGRAHREGRARARRLVDAKLVTECDVRSDDDVDRVFAETGDAFGGGLDLLVHSVAFAAAEDLEGRFIDTPRDRFWMAVDISAYSLVACAQRRGAADAGARRRLDRDDDLPRRRSRRAALQRDGRRQGDARRVACATSPGTSARAASASTPSRPGRCARSRPARSRASRRWRRCSSSGRRFTVTSTPTTSAPRPRTCSRTTRRT